MGIAEAICVVYLRQLILPVGEMVVDVRSLDHYSIEVWREACTIVMLAAVGWLAGSSAVSRFGYFIAAFGIWDICYYAGLYWASGWPTSLLEWDCLFLIPCPWYGPVLAPVLISLLFIASCGLILRAERSGRPIRLSPARFALLAAGWAIWILSFTLPAAWHHAAIHPPAYPWWALMLGALPAIAAAWPRI